MVDLLSEDFYLLLSSLSCSILLRKFILCSFFFHPENIKHLIISSLLWDKCLFQVPNSRSSWRRLWVISFLPLLGTIPWMLLRTLWLIPWIVMSWAPFTVWLKFYMMTCLNRTSVRRCWQLLFRMNCIIDNLLLSFNVERTYWILLFTKLLVSRNLLFPKTSSQWQMLVTCCCTLWSSIRKWRVNIDSAIVHGLLFPL